MKKLLGIVVLGLLLSGNAYAENFNSKLIIGKEYCGHIIFNSEFKIRSYLKFNASNNSDILNANYTIENYDRNDPDNNYGGDGEIYNGVLIAVFQKLFDRFVVKMMGDDDFTITKVITMTFDSDLNYYTGEWLTEDGVGGKWEGSICK